MQPMMLEGKWVWLWNWPRCIGDGGEASRVAERLRNNGCRGALLKAFDGPRWFDQGRPWREIAEELKANGAAPPVATAPRTYTVQTGDTLSGIAANLGLDSWQRLYEANAGVIGADPDRIYPGQVLVVP